MVQELSSKWNKKAGSWGTNWGVGQFMGHSRKICWWVIYYFIFLCQSQNIQIFYECSYLSVLVTSVFSFFQQYCISIVAWRIEHSVLSRMFYAPFHSNYFNKKEAQMFHDRKRGWAGLPEKANAQAKEMEASSEEWS